MNVQISKIIINYDICDPKKCNYECIGSCPVKKRANDNDALRKSNGKPLLDEAFCTQCGKCVSACPLGAIGLFEIPGGENPKISMTYPEINLGKWRKSPYIVDKKNFQPSSEHDTIFARVGHDKTYSHHKKGIFDKMDELIASNKPGYSRIDYAFTMSAWKVSGFQSVMTKASEKKVEKYNYTDIKKMSGIVKQVSRANGAALVGIAKLNRDWLYTHDRQGKPLEISENISNVIVIAVEMDLEAIQSSPDLIGGYATGNGYSKMAFVLTGVTAFIRNLGYDAIAAGNGVARSVPLAIDAGIGQYGRHGILITEKYGSNVRLCKILTNMPLEYDNPIDFGVIKFCEVCKTCAETCPSQSISYDDLPSWEGATKSNNGAILKYYVNVETCYAFWTRNGGDCSNCISSCAFTKSSHWSHGVVRFFIKYAPFLNKFWVKLDKFFYDKKRDPDEFWNEGRTFIQLR